MSVLELGLGPVLALVLGQMLLLLRSFYLTNVVGFAMGTVAVSDYCEKNCLSSDTCYPSFVSFPGSDSGCEKSNLIPNLEVLSIWGLLSSVLLLLSPSRLPMLIVEIRACLVRFVIFVVA